MFNWFAHLKIAHKLALGFGLVLLLMGGTLAADVTASTQQSALADRLVHHLFPARMAAREIVTWVRSADDDGAWYILTRKPAQAAALLHTYYADTQRVQANLAAARALADTASQRTAMQSFVGFGQGLMAIWPGTSRHLPSSATGKSERHRRCT
jgi:CHASE3 domain sensor protein